MWEIYPDDSRPEPHDLQSGVENLRALFSNLEQSLNQELLYGRNRFLSTSEYYEMVIMYHNGAEECQRFLDQNDIKAFILEMKKLKLHGYLSYLKKYLYVEDVISLLPKRMFLNIFYNDYHEDDENSSNHEANDGRAISIEE